jgi:hypothetical protein
MSETEKINDTEFIEVIDIDDRIIKLEKNHPLYYTEDNKNYSCRYSFKEIFGTLDNYLRTGYEALDIVEFDMNVLKKDQYEGKFILKIVTTDEEVIKSYYTFIGFESEDTIKVIPYKIPLLNMYTIDPLKVLSFNWYYIESDRNDDVEYMTVYDS